VAGLGSVGSGPIDQRSRAPEEWRGCAHGFSEEGHARDGNAEPPLRSAPTLGACCCTRASVMRDEICCGAPYDRVPDPERIIPRRFQVMGLAG
jgi:hypothetical protein